MKSLPGKVRVFLVVLYLTTIFFTIFFVRLGFIQLKLVGTIQIIFFSALTALTETFTVLYKNICFTTTFAITVASYILFGPLSAIIIIILGFSFRILKKDNGYRHIFNTPFYGTASNYCILVLPALIANYIFVMLGGITPVDNIGGNLFKLIIFSGIYLLINTILISILYSLMTNKNSLFAFLSNIKLMLLNILAMAPFGFVIAFIYEAFGYLGVILLIFPVILARYSFSQYIDAKSQYIQTVNVLMRAMEARDKYTEGHSQRVAQISEKIARELKYNEWQVENLNMAAMLHDVGKIGIDDSILNKPGRLTEAEYNTIKQHPDIGYNILKEVKNMKNILPIVKYHHERFDGKGYPEGKDVDELSMDVFIVQLADSIDAMATDRPYRKAQEQESIIEEVKKCKGTQFHPRVVDAYLRVLEKQKKVT